MITKSNAINSLLPVDINRSGCITKSTGDCMKRVSMFVFLSVLVMAIQTTVSVAQTGTISGEVHESSSGETLIGATIMVRGTTLGAASDIDGRFTLRWVPVGEQTLVISYIGFDSREVTVVVREDERIDINIDLTPSLLEGDEVTVIGYQVGQARALTRQRESVNIRSVISSEQIDRFTSTTVDGALSRVAGMHGGNNIRGVGAAMSNVTVDGQRMGTTGKGDRSVDLGTISADMVQELDVVKVITPDMDADALAGVINISTRRSVGGGKEFGARLGGGWDQRYGNNIGSSSRLALNYGDSPGGNFSYALNFSYQRDPRASEMIQTDWVTMNFTSSDGPVDVLQDMRTELQFDIRERYGTGLQLTFQPTNRTTYHVQGMFNVQERERMLHSIVFNPRNYISQNETKGDRSPDSRMRYNSRLQPYTIHQYTFQAGARHLFDSFDMEYKLGWGHGRYYESRYGFEFQTPQDFEYFVNIEDRLHPTFDFIGTPYPRSNLFRLEYVDNQWDVHIDNEYSAKIDFDIPHRVGSFKFGSNVRMTYKDGDHEENRMAYDQAINVLRFDMMENMDWNIFDRSHHTYHIPYMMDLNAGRDFYYHQHPHFMKDLERWAESETQKFNANENTFAGYGMASLRFGRFRFLGGVRLEHTSTSYDGREGVINADGRYGGSTDVSSQNNYTHIFPNAQFVFALGSRTNFRLAYSRSIGRPNFNQLAPYRLLNYDRETIRSGNPGLKPMLSHNYDILFEHYFMNVGELTLGFYYKDLSDFIYLFESRLTQGDFEGWIERTYLNGENASVYGFEASWQQHLQFLPGFLGNLGTFVNYTWSRSIADIDRDRDRYGTFPLPDQRPHIVNAGLDFNQGPFSSHVYYSWSSDVLRSYGNLRWVPEIQLQERVYFDRFSTGNNSLSASFRYRLTRNFRIWLDATDLLNTISIDYFYDLKYYPYTSQMSGRKFNIGVRYSL